MRRRRAAEHPRDRPNGRHAAETAVIVRLRSHAPRPACHLRERRTGRGRGQPVRHRYSAPDELAIPGRWLRRWGGVAAVAVACSLLAPAARTAMPAAQLAQISAAAGLLGTDSP